MITLVSTFPSGDGPQPGRQRSDSPAYRFAPDGALVARATMPQRLTPMEIGTGYLLGVERDELDVESVVLVTRPW